MFNVTPVRAFRDNYIWLIHGATNSKRVAVVDPGEAGPVFAALEANSLEPAAILATHHHYDHTGGITELVGKYDVPVFTPASERVAGATHPVARGDRVEVPALGLAFDVLDIPGHTAGHIAFYGHGALFCGDTLFSAGCGRLFEGTAQQMLDSLNTLSALPGATRVFCGHEYTQANLRFASTVEPGNKAISRYQARAAELRADDLPTLPSSLELETQVNPFLRCHLDSVQKAVVAHAGHSLDNVTAVFAALRGWKDSFA